jgi:hypothetical protein
MNCQGIFSKQIIHLLAVEEEAGRGQGLHICSGIEHLVARYGSD